MREVAAIKTALGLLHLPASLRRIRSDPLPADVDVLLRIVAGDEDEMSAAARLTERDPAVIREAAVFYIEQVLLSPGSDNYRVLGAAPDASAQDLRRNMALLMTWLHPDKDLAGDRAVLAARVTRAWNDLRSPDRRAAYDATLGAAQTRRRVQAPKLRSAPHGKAATLHNLSHHSSSKTSQNGLQRSESDSLFRRGWTLLRRALRSPESS